MSTYAGKDDTTDVLLDFIAGGVPGNPVGESMGNYNAVIGKVHASDDLSQKTLTEIYALMADRLAAGMPSTAIGRYQIIKKTLRNLQTAKRLPDGTLFTPKLQDSLAVALLVARGYAKWWDGKRLDEDFLHGLSCEWASLPDPMNDGKSHYDGDSAGNHASTTLAACYAALRRARAAQKQPAEMVRSSSEPAGKIIPENIPGAVPGSAPGPLAWLRRQFGA